jgi:hypothetical protein
MEIIANIAEWRGQKAELTMCLQMQPCIAENENEHTVPITGFRSSTFLRLEDSQQPILLPTNQKEERRSAGRLKCLMVGVFFSRKTDIFFGK